MILPFMYSVHVDPKLAVLVIDKEVAQTTAIAESVVTSTFEKKALVHKNESCHFLIDSFVIGFVRLPLHIRFCAELTSRSIKDNG